MKQHTSIFMLLSRSSIYRVLLRFAGLILAESGLFYWAMQRKWNLICEGNIGLEGLLSDSQLFLVFVFCFAQITGILSNVGFESESQVGYTLQRLSVSEKTIVLWHWCYNCLCFLMLWWVQILTALGLCLWYVKAAPAEMVTGQTIMLACYRNAFLRHLFPLADIFGWIRNAALIITFGLLTAKAPYFNRRGKKYPPLAWTTMLVWFGFSLDTTNNMTVALMSAAECLLICLVAVCTLMKGDEFEDEEEVLESEA